MPGRRCARCNAAMHRRFDSDQRFRRLGREAFAIKGRSNAMTIETAIVIAAIISAFALFGIVLASVDRYTQHAPKSDR
jgi:hypothetical protein